MDAAGDWDDGNAARARADRPRRRAPGGGCTVYRPDIGGLLPVYVADRYEGIEARTFAECSDEEVARYVDANVAAVREVRRARAARAGARQPPGDGPGDPRPRRSAGEVPYAVKVHGSALEYTVKPDPERFLGLAREGLAGARAILVGSRHTAASLWEALGDPAICRERTRLGPPGVDVERFRPARARARPRPACAALASAPARRSHRRATGTAERLRPRRAGRRRGAGSAWTPGATGWWRSWAS